ncbi:hypothetical protein C8R44DRAFT_754471 [Mycena epipterygia]|nr:hypothetical protein C8R44DRAFT_754471 [Mycena epipterygia]
MAIDLQREQCTEAEKPGAKFQSRTIPGGFEQRGGNPDQDTHHGEQPGVLDSVGTIADELEQERRLTKGKTRTMVGVRNKFENAPAESGHFVILHCINIVCPPCTAGGNGVKRWGAIRKYWSRPTVQSDGVGEFDIREEGEKHVHTTEGEPRENTCITATSPVRYSLMGDAFVEKALLERVICSRPIKPSLAAYVLDVFLVGTGSNWVTSAYGFRHNTAISVVINVVINTITTNELQPTKVPLYDIPRCKLGASELRLQAAASVSEVVIHHPEKTA